MPRTGRNPRKLGKNGKLGKTKRGGVKYTRSAAKIDNYRNTVPLTNETVRKLLYTDVHSTVSIQTILPGYPTQLNIKEWLQANPLSTWNVSGVTDMTELFKSGEENHLYFLPPHHSERFYYSPELSRFYYLKMQVSSWDVSNVTTMRGMFEGCKGFDGDLSAWNVSKVTDMSGMFTGCSTFNGNLSAWNVSNVTNMSGMFTGCSSFTGDLSAWDVSNVTNMSGMFTGCSSFNQSLSAWDVSKVTDMSGMFTGCSKFNASLFQQVSKVENMSAMFKKAAEFNQPIKNWNVENVENMSTMFLEAEAFNQPIGNWNVSNVEDMSSMFESAEAFNQPIENWNVEKVTTMSGMFCASEFNQPIGNWNVENVTDMSRMFQYCNFNQPIEDWKVANVTNMSSMFQGALAFNQPLQKWNVEKVTTMSVMFGGTSEFNQPIEDWNVAKVTDMTGMFQGALAFNQPLQKWNVENVTNMISMFQGALAFNQPIGDWYVANVTSMSCMFASASMHARTYPHHAFNQDIGGWDVGNVRDMEGMFKGASTFNQNIGSWNVSKVRDMNGMFALAASFNQSLQAWDIRNVRDISYMFWGAAAFDQIPQGWSNGLRRSTDWLRGTPREDEEQALAEAYEQAAAAEAAEAAEAAAVEAEAAAVEAEAAELAANPDRITDGQFEERGEHEGVAFAVHNITSRINVSATLAALQTLTTHEYGVNDFVNVSTVMGAFGKFLEDTIRTLPSESEQSKFMKELTLLRRDRFRYLPGLGKLNGQAHPLKIIHITTQFLMDQPIRFQQEYTKSFVHDNCHAYGSDVGEATANGLSCSEGVLERVLLAIAQAVNQVSSNPSLSAEEKEEIETKYQDVLNVMFPMTSSVYQDRANTTVHERKLLLQLLPLSYKEKQAACKAAVESKVHSDPSFQVLAAEKQAAFYNDWADAIGYAMNTEEQDSELDSETIIVNLALSFFFECTQVQETWYAEETEIEAAIQIPLSECMVAKAFEAIRATYPDQTDLFLQTQRPEDLEQKRKALARIVRMNIANDPNYKNSIQARTRKRPRSSSDAEDSSSSGGKRDRGRRRHRRRTPTKKQKRAKR